jgi:hypothetical protein
MHIIKPLVAALVGLASLATASSAVASGMDREWVPGSALTTYRAVAAQFASTTSAQAAGYGLIHDNAGIYCIADPAGSGAMGYHWVDVGNLLDGSLDPNHPEAIVYEKRADGSFHLVALEYIVTQEAWGSVAPELFPGHPFMATGADNRFGLPAYYSQHVWVGKGNPLGNLAMWNPAVHC